MTNKTVRPRVVIADDHPEMVRRAAGLLSESFEVVATAHDGRSALDCIRRLSPDVALLDLYMPGMTGLDVVKTLNASAASTQAVIMTGYDDPELASAAIAAGAMGFVTKSQLNDDLLPAMRSALQGSVFVSKNSIPK